MLNKSSKVFVLLLILFSFLLAESGMLNVFTSPDADIYIDGELVGKEQVLRHELPEGLHYVQVKRNNKVLRSERVMVDAGRVQTVVMDNFQDYRTDVASRGAIEVEAERLRETRGNFGFGLYGGSPASGLSLKWWPNDRIGLQAIGYLNNQSNQVVDSRGGARLLYSFTDLAYKGSPLSFYAGVGTGRSMVKDNSEGDRTETYDLTEGVLGMEFKLASLYGSDDSQEQRHVVINGDSDPFMLMFNSLFLGIGEAFVRLTSFSLELGVERVFARKYDSTVGSAVLDYTGVKFSGGMHVYF